MAKFILENQTFCIVLSITLIALFVYLIRYRRDILKKAALYAVAKAEDYWGSNTGRIKFAEAYLYIKKNYPVITFFVSEKQLNDIIEDALMTLKQIKTSKKSVEKKEIQ